MCITSTITIMNAIITCTDPHTRLLPRSLVSQTSGRVNLGSGEPEGSKFPFSCHGSLAGGNIVKLCRMAFKWTVNKPMECDFCLFVNF